MAAVNMGVYYLLAAAADYRPFFLWTVPFRLLTFAVFTLLVVTGAAPARFIGVGIWRGSARWSPGRALVGARAPGRAGRYAVARWRGLGGNGGESNGQRLTNVEVEHPRPRPGPPLM